MKKSNKSTKLQTVESTQLLGFMAPADMAEEFNRYVEKNHLNKSAIMREWLTDYLAAKGVITSKNG